MKKIITLACIFSFLLSGCLADEYSDQFMGAFEEWYEPMEYVTDPELQMELYVFVLEELELLFPSLTEEQIRKFECTSPIGVSREDGQAVWFVFMTYDDLESVGIDFHIIRDNSGILQLIWHTPHEIDKVIEVMDSCIQKEEAFAVAYTRLSGRIRRYQELMVNEITELRLSTGYNLTDASEFECYTSFFCEFNQGSEEPIWDFSFTLNTPEGSFLARYYVSIDAGTGDIISEFWDGFLLEID